MVKASDIYVLVGLVAPDQRPRTFRELATRLAVPVPLVQRALNRAATSGLYESSSKSVHLPNFEEFLVHAVRFVAPARLGQIVPGVPAAWAAQPLVGLIVESEGELPPVWPSASGRVRGQALQPLHKAAVEAAENSAALAALLAVVDSLRAGDVRVRGVAAGVLHDMLRETASGRG